MNVHIPGDNQAFLYLTSEAIQSLTTELVQRPLTPHTIEKWLHDWADLEILFQERLARLDITADVNPTDTEAGEKRKVYRQTIWPLGEKFSAAMEGRLLEHEAILPHAVQPHITRLKRSRSLNKTDEMMALLNQESELKAQYGQALAAQRQQESEAIFQIWCKMLDIRQTIAEKNGFANYIDYRWEEMGRYDYTPDDSRVLHHAFLDYWSPLYERIKAKERESDSQKSVSAPNADTLAGEKLPRPFKDAADLVAKVGRIFHRLDPEFEAAYDHLIKIGLLNIVDSMSEWGFARVVGRTGVFVLVNLSPESEDIVGLIHEMGHVFAAVASIRQPCHFFWGCPDDFGETPSSAMEMLTMPFWDEFYTSAALSQVKRGYFGGVVISCLDSIIGEAFQLWAYSHLDDARDAARCGAKWLELHQTYTPNPYWHTRRDEIERGWQHRHVFFHAPLFGMEYVYGRLAGLNLLNMNDAVTRYKTALALGKRLEAKDLFTTLGTHFFFTAEDVANAARQLEAYWR